MGAAVGGLLGTYFHGNALAFGMALFAIGVACAVFRVERTAYRYSCITLGIVMLVTRPTNTWLIAWHRYAEVSIGIDSGLVISAAWPEERASGSSTAAKGSRAGIFTRELANQ